MINGVPLVELVGVSKVYRDSGFGSLFGRGRPGVHAVSDVGFAIEQGENFALVGESGSGKSTTARMVMRLEAPSSGTIRFHGTDLQRLRGKALKSFQASTHIVFQDPNLSLSPRMRVAEIIAEPLEIQRMGARERTERVNTVFDEVGLSPAVAERYPHEFSGGQRQRIAIARAIALRPRLIVLDEPVSALDVSIRAQILNLLKDLQLRLGLTYLTIAHDLAVVYQACDRTAVMYLGRLMEVGPTESVFKRPLHPYTTSLLASIPLPDPRRRRRVTAPVVEDVGARVEETLAESGCPFRDRCPHAVARCEDEIPAWREVEEGRWVACHLVDTTSLGAVPPGATTTGRRPSEVT